MNAHVSVPTATGDSVSCLAERFAGLLAERERAREEMRAADKRHTARLPASIKLRFRSPFGSLVVEIDDGYLRECLPRYSASSPKGRRLRQLLARYEAQQARARASQVSSGFAAAHGRHKASEAALSALAIDTLASRPGGIQGVVAHAIALVVVASGRYDLPPFDPRGLVRALGSIAEART